MVLVPSARSRRWSCCLGHRSSLEEDRARGEYSRGRHSDQYPEYERRVQKLLLNLVAVLLPCAGLDASLFLANDFVNFRLAFLHTSVISPTHRSPVKPSAATPALCVSIRSFFLPLPSRYNLSSRRSSYLATCNCRRLRVESNANEPLLRRRSPRASGVYDRRLHDLHPQKSSLALQYAGVSHERDCPACFVSIATETVTSCPSTSHGKLFRFDHDIRYFPRQNRRIEVRLRRRNSR